MRNVIVLKLTAIPTVFTFLDYLQYREISVWQLSVSTGHNLKDTILSLQNRLTADSGK